MVIFCEVRKNHHELYILMTFRTFMCFLTYLTDVKILPTDMFSFLKHYKDSITSDYKIYIGLPPYRPLENPKANFAKKITESQQNHVTSIPKKRNL